MHAPRFAKEEIDLEESSRHAKQWVCPHCGRHETLNRHGFLRGYAEGASEKDALRGRRFFCSNRRRRPGCGRTFTVLLASVIRHATVRSCTLWRFFQARVQTGSVLAAWERVRSPFSIEAAYRWWRRWQHGQFRLRTWVYQRRAPPADPAKAALIEQVSALFGPDDPIAAVQLAQQQPWPG